MLLLFFSVYFILFYFCVQCHICKWNANKIAVVFVVDYWGLFVKTLDRAVRFLALAGDYDLFLGKTPYSQSASLCPGV